MSRRQVINGMLGDYIAGCEKSTPYKVPISLDGTSPFSIRFPESGLDPMIKSNMEVFKTDFSNDTTIVDATVNTYNGYLEIAGTTTAAVDIAVDLMSVFSAT